MAEGQRLAGRIGRFQLFALGFGSIIGSAWVVILNRWFAEAGPMGAVLGFVAGGIAVVCIGACYAELTARVPKTGGDFTFALAAFGPRLAFFVGWFTALGWISVTVFEGLAVAWVVELLLPGLDDVVLYTLFDAPVTRNQLLIGTAGALLMTIVNYLGGAASARFQGLLTYGFLAVALALLVVMAGTGDPALLLPAFPEMPGGAPWWHGSLAIFASCAFLLNGFQTIAQAVEERAGGISLRTIARVMIASIVAAALFYCLAVTAAAMMKPWSELAGADLAMVEAVRGLPMGDTLARILLVILLASLLKTWNGVYFAGTRILYGLAARGFLPRGMTALHPHFGSPYRIVLIIGVINVAGLLLGRGAVGMLVDTSATSIVICFVLCCAAVFVLRRKQTQIPEFVVPGGRVVIGFAFLAALTMAASALVTPLLRSAFPVEYLILGGWAGLGALTLALRRKAYDDTGPRSQEP